MAKCRISDREISPVWTMTRKHRGSVRRSTRHGVRSDRLRSLILAQTTSGTTLASVDPRASSCRVEACGKDLRHLVVPQMGPQESQLHGSSERVSIPIGSALFVALKGRADGNGAKVTGQGVWWVLGCHAPLVSTQTHNMAVDSTTQRLSLWSSSREQHSDRRRCFRRPPGTAVCHSSVYSGRGRHGMD